MLMSPDALRRYKSRSALKKRHEQFSDDPRKLDNNSLSICGFKSDYKTSNTVCPNKYKKQLTYWLPYINKLIARIVDIADRKQELEQVAKITIWNMMLKYGDDVSPSIVYTAIKAAIRNEYLKDEKITSFKMSTERGLRYRRAITKLTKQNNRQPIASEIAEYLNVGLREVQNYLLQESYSFLQHDEPMPNCRTKQWQYYSYYLNRKRRLEDRIIHIIDANWINSVYQQIRGSMRKGIDAIMSDMSVAEWSKRNKYPVSTVDNAIRRAIALGRALHSIKFRANSTIHPLEALKQEKISIRQFLPLRKKNLKKQEL